MSTRFSPLYWLLAAIVYPSLAFAQNGPGTLNLSGSLFNADGTAVAQSAVNFKVDMFDGTNTCVLYTEQFLNVDLSASKGGFSFVLGSAANSANASNKLSGSGFNLQLFVNSGATVTPSGCGTSVALTTGTPRILHISYDLGSGLVAMSPNVTITSTPFAMVADTLQGKAPTDFVLTNTNPALTQSNIESVFNPTQFPILQSLLAGTDGKYISSSPSAAVDFNGQRLTNLSAPTTGSDAVTKTYADGELGGLTLNASGVGLGIGNGKTLVWDQTAGQWVAQTVGSVSSITASTGLLGGTITNIGTISVDVGTAANQIVQLNPSAQLSALDGSLLFNVNAAFLGGRAVASTAPTAGQILTYDATLLQWVPGTSSGITALTGDVSATGPGSAAATINNDAVNASAKIKSSGIATNRIVITDAISGTTLAYGACSLNQIYQWTSTGWACADVSSMLGNVNVSAVGTYGNSSQVAQVTVDAQGRITQLSNVNIAFPVTMVAGRTGAVTLSTTDISGLGTAALQNYGTAAGNLVQLDGTAHIPASLLPTGTGMVTAVVAGNAMIGGGTSGAVTLSADVGVTANKIVQFDASARYPANDGSQITNVNASNIIGKGLGSVAPSAGQVLTYNTLLGAWDAESSSASSNTFVQGGNAFGATAVLGTNDANALAFRTNGATAMTILTNGYVGIGLTNPSANLQLGRPDTTTELALRLSTNSGNDWKMYQPIGTSNLRFYNDNSGDLVTYTTNGRVGIGTITPATTLDLAGALSVRGMSAPSLSPAGQGRIYFDSVSNQFLVSQNGGGYSSLASAGGTVTSIVSGTGLIANTITSAGTLNVDVGTAASKIVQFDASARYPANDGSLITNVNASNLIGKGLGAVTPSAGQVLTYNASLGKWDAETASGGGFVNGGNSFGVATSLGTRDNNNLTLLTNNSPAMTILTNGEVGIGTTSPSQLLSVYNATGTNSIINIEAAKNDPSATASVVLSADYTNYSFLQLYGLGASWFMGEYGSKNFVVVDSTTATTPLTIEQATPTNSVYVKASGNVGLGTTTPTSKLEVSGGSIVSDSVSNTVAYINFGAGNVQMSSTSATSINICGLKDGGSYTLVLTGITPGATVSIAAYPTYTNTTSCSGTAMQVDLGAGAANFTSAGNTQILSFIYFASRGANGTVYGVPATNYNF